MKIAVGLLGILLLATSWLGIQQRILAECTITYKISADSSSDKEAQQSLHATTKTVYIKGNNSRTDLVSPSFSQSVIFDKSTGNAVILRTFGNNKFMTRLDTARWIEKNKKYENLTLIPVNETKTIAGYDCRKMILQLKDTSRLSVYYATAIAPSVKEFEFQFKDVPGFVLEYEVEEHGKKITYTATRVNISPVSATMFNIPTSGYRLLPDKE